MEQTMRERLWDEALELLMQLKSDPADPVLRAAVEVWRERSLEHDTVWSEAVGLDGMMGIAARGEEKRRVTRRSLLVAGGIGLSGAVLAAALGPRLLLQAEADFITATAEVRPVELEDGSTVTLGPDSAISHTFTATERRVKLLAGLAFFDVAHDPTRPFGVRAGRLKATALGTSFEMAMDRGRTGVFVDEGKVAVALPDADEQLAAGEWVSLFDSGVAKRGTQNPGGVASWRRGQLLAAEERVSDVVARLARWQGGSVIIADASLGDEVISGVFNLTEPQLALEAAVGPFGGKVRQFSPMLTVISKI